MSRARPAILGLLVAVLALAGCPAGEPDGEESTTEPAMSDMTSAPPEGDMTEPGEDGMQDDEMSEAETEVPEALAFTAPTVGGGELAGAELAGEPVVFWFWASWCPRCAAAASDVAAVQAEYAGQVHVVGVAGLGSGDSGMDEFVDRHGLDEFPHLADDEGQVWQHFGVTTQEHFVILDAGGDVVHDGSLRAAALRDQLDALVS